MLSNEAFGLRLSILPLYRGVDESKEEHDMERVSVRKTKRYKAKRGSKKERDVDKINYLCHVSGHCLDYGI